MNVVDIYKTNEGDFLVAYRNYFKKPHKKIKSKKLKTFELVYDELLFERVSRENINKWCLDHNIILEINNKEIHFYERA
ncbi:MAG: hypothetical protein K6E87_02215 [bacterium]|nr:hypothetical protein [bacterium]